jgi:hypothetical protein
MDYSDINKKLTLKQKKFCELYSGNSEFFGNGVQSYLSAYNVDMNKPNAYVIAKSGARENLTKPHILSYINELLEAEINQVFVDKQLGMLIIQNADLPTKLGAIREYNKLKGRIINRLDHTTAGESFNVEVVFITDEKED